MFLDVLKRELMVALGCTEPISIALASAKAREVLGEMPDRLVLELSANMIKNAFSVNVPGGLGEKGIEISSILGVLCGNSSSELEVLENVTPTEVEKAKKLKREGFVEVKLVDSDDALYVKAIAYRGEDYSSVTIIKEHSNIVHIEKNGKTVFDKKVELSQSIYSEYSFDKIYNFAKNTDYTELKEILDKQLEYNYAISEEGIKNNWGSSIGKMLYSDGSTNVQLKAVAYGSAGSDARMSGCALPVVINCGSGNQGITIASPIYVYAKEYQVDKDRIYRALIFANLMALYQKQQIGRLSAYCGVVSAASASISGIAFLMGYDKKIVEESFVNSLVVNSGMLCDGAKPSCAMKIASSLSNAFVGLNQALEGKSFRPGDGVVMDTVDETINAVAKIAREGMLETDKIIIREMLSKNNSVLKRV